MTGKYQKHYSTNLQRDMEYMTYGESGRPVLVIPSQSGRYFDYDNFGMTDVLAPWIENHRIRLICADSIDDETWSLTDGDGAARSVRHEAWFRYITEELIPAVQQYDGEMMIITGCSMGAYHSANFFFRRPDLFTSLIALSGVYRKDYFFGDYMDDTLYLNSPLHYLPNMPTDHPYWHIYRERDIILCVGQGAWEDDMLRDTREMQQIMAEHNVPVWIDYWGFDVAHDWPWWRKQIVYFIPKVLAED